MRDFDFVFTGLQPWDIPIGSNAIDIAREVATQNRVLYVNAPLDISTLIRGGSRPETARRIEVLKGKSEPLRRLSANLYVLDLPFSIFSVNGLPDGRVFDFVNRINNRKIFRYIRKVVHKQGFKKVIHFIDNDIYRSFYSKELLKPERTVYYRRDNLQPYAYWNKHAPRLEPLLIAKSELVLCNSPYYADYASRFNSNSLSIGQGVDLSAYDAEKSYDTPPGLQPIPLPRIGYIGDITSVRLDPDLLYEVAIKRPGYSFVMTGGEDEVFRNHRLHQLSNVYFTGSIPKQDVARYMASFQVCLNPQKINDITQGNYPRKVDEYLAMGKPVVATRTMTMEMFRSHVYLCTGSAEFVESIDKALADSNVERIRDRIAFASTHSWKNNVEKIYAAITQTSKQ